MDDNLEKALERLKTDYIEGSGDKLDGIDAIIDRLYRGDGDRGADVVDMQREIHSLKGSAGTYGFSSVSLIAHRLEDYIEATNRLSKDQLRDVQTYIDEIRRIFQSGVNPTETEMDAILRALPSGTATLVSAQEVRHVIVLLVMPKGVQRRLVGGELASCGFELSFAESPLEAIGLALSLKPDIVVSSMEMEPLTGAELGRVLKTIEATSKAAFVLITSHEDDSGILKTLPEGAHVIHKGPKFSEQLSNCLIDIGVLGTFK